MVSYTRQLENKHSKIQKMATSNTKVCNIQLILYIRLIFGFNFKQPSPKMRIISRLYVIVIVCFALSCFYYKILTMYNFTKTNFLMDYLTNAIYYFISEDEHLLHFFETIPVLDTLPYAKELYKKLQKYLISTQILIIVARILMMGTFCLIVPEYSRHVDQAEHYIVTTLLLATDLRHTSLILIYSLLYVRVKIFKNAIENNGFGDQRYAARKFIQMYEAILDALEFKSCGMKLMVRID